MTTIICAIGWLGTYIVILAYIYYMHSHHLPTPNDSEMNECINYCVNKMFDNFLNKK